MIGGMIWPPVDATASTPAANGALKLVRFISGMVLAPVTITLATALPDTVPNSDEDLTATLPGPPAERPVSARAKHMHSESGRSSCRESVCQYVSITAAAGSLTKQHN